MTRADEPRTDMERRRARTTEDDTRAGYYGVPAIHKPHWKWLIIFYFFLGGISGASYAIASIARLLGGEDNRRIARAGYYISLATLIPSPILLVLDLGRPERFHRMLRILKIRSPMSVGSWILTAFGGFCGLSAMIQAAHDGLLGRGNAPVRLLCRLPARAVGSVGIAPGFLLSGYTGVLVAATAVPVWTKNHLLMGPLFLASGVSNATAAISLTLSFGKSTGPHTLHRLERLERVAPLSELGLLLLNHARLGQVIARPMVEGPVGRLYRFGVLGMGLVAPLTLGAGSALARRPSSRRLVALSSALVLAGGFVFRYVIVVAGRDSADDPEATFHLAKRNGVSGD